MLVLDRVRQRVLSDFDGGGVVLGPATAGMQRLRDAGGDGPFTFRYLLTDAAETAWEYGLAILSVPNPGNPADHGFAQLLRIQSSNGGNQIDLVDAGGTFGYLHCVPTSADAVLTDSFAAPTAAENIGGFLVLGGGASATANTTIAIGPVAQALADNASAIGYNTVAGVPGAYTESDQSEETQRAHIMRWAGRAISTGTSSVPLLHGAGHRFVPREGAAYLLDVRLVGRRTAPATGAWAASARVLVHRPVGGAAEIVGAPAFAVDAASAGITCTASLSIVSGGLQISAAGSASGETWRWAASVSGVEQWGN